ncbi:MAG: hypothetical protein IPK71_11435 [Myxococcales bacterium]|nr:hypothetical protein [Myxococcales bacterium]
MHSAIDRVFDAATLAAYGEYLAATPAPAHAEHVRHRHDVLSAHGRGAGEAAHVRRQRRLRSQRAVLDAYIEAAYVCGVLDGHLTERLRAIDPGAHASAVATCLACWVFGGMLACRVSSRGGEGALGVSSLSDTYAVEVRVPEASVDGVPEIASALELAPRPLAPQPKNLLVLVPRARTHRIDRAEVERALVGDLTLDARGGTGWLAQRPDVSAVVIFEVLEAHATDEPSEPGDLAEWSPRRTTPDSDLWPEHGGLVVHNPFAAYPTSDTTFARFPELVKRGTSLVWTDV